MNRDKKLFYILSIALIVIGCSTPIIKKQNDLSIDKMKGKPPEFILGVGDTIEISVYRKRESEAILGVGDALEIKVYRNDDFNRSVQLDVSGMVTIPLIGDVQAVGKHVNALKNEIQNKLSKFLVNPQVSISVETAENLKIEDLSFETKIGPTGKITFPLVGEVQFSGRNIHTLRDEIEKKLMHYIDKPQVRIQITSIESQKIHVLGEVESPGTFILEQRTLAWEAIPKAGGFTDDANQKKVLLLRKEKGEGRIATLNIKDLLKTGKIDQNIYLRNGDIIYVPPTFIADFEKFMVRFSNIISPVISLQRATILWPDLIDAIRGKSDTNVFVQP